MYRWNKEPNKRNKLILCLFVFILSKGSLPVFKGIFWWTNKKHISVNYLTYNFWSRFVFRKHRLLANYFVTLWCNMFMKYDNLNNTCKWATWLFVYPLPQYFKGKRSRNFWKLFLKFFFHVLFGIHINK